MIAHYLYSHYSVPNLMGRINNNGEQILQKKNV